MDSSASLNRLTLILTRVREILFSRRRPGSKRDDSGRPSGPFGAALGAVALAILAAGPASAVPVTFHFHPSGTAQSVAVAGSFNRWSVDANPMTEHDGTWTATVELASGEYQYKYVVNGTQWIADKSAKKLVDDGFGGKNSVVDVGDQAMDVGPGVGAAPAAGASPAASTPAADGKTPVTFRYRPKGGAQSVSVAGSFNNWDAGANPMTEKNGVWEATVNLAPGEIQYKFVVDGTQWITDETAAGFADDGYGGKNSVLKVGSTPLTVGIKGGEPVGGVTPPPAPATGGKTPVTFRYQPVIGGVNTVTVAGTMNGWDAGATPMADKDGDGVWETTLNLDPGRYEYKFVVNGDQWFTDDFAMDSSPDGLGGENAVVIVKDQPLILGPGGNVPAKGQVPSEGLHQVTFRYQPAGKVNKVTLAGSFNDWNADKTPMAGPDKNGEYSFTLLLPAGDYQYKFVADGNWITDRAHADSFVDDGFGGQNSVIKVDARFPVLKVEKGDGKISDVGLDYAQTGSTVNNMGEGRVELTFKSQRNDIETMDVLVSDAAGERTLPASVTGRDQAFSYWRAVVTDAPASFRYLPAYRDGETTDYLTAEGMASAKPPTDAWWSFTVSAFPPFETPDWVKDAVIYQIFPDRYRNGDPTNDPDFSEWYYAGKTTLPASGKTNEEYYHLVKDWYDVAGLTRSPYRTDGKPDYFSFYGGDIAGVEQSLDYLKDLGVTAIYFNPIFQAKSNHKYDCADYMKLDPHFGTNEEFKQFVAAAHAKGIHVILDIVFNHTGNAHWAFQDAVKNGPKSKTYDWYEFKKWPLPASFGPGGPKPEDYYYCWWGFGDLPDLNYDLSRANPQENAIRNISEAKVNQPLLDHLMDVTQYWIGDMDADGVRLDVPNEVPFWFWKEFNRKVKGIKQDAYIVGEIWGNASDWISPTIFDATMNYAYFRDPVIKFLGQGRGSAQEFDRTLATGRNAYPTQAVQVMMNLIDSHDTVRFRQQVNGDLARVRLAYLFGMTYVGAPDIYYGDEVGMTGGADPDCRRPFLWNWKDDPERVAMHDYTATLAKARAAHEALRRGDFRTLMVSGPVYAYLRTAGTDRVVVALNAGGTAATASLDLGALGNPTQAVNLVTGETVQLGDGTLELAPASGVALALQ